ncbi:ABC transporter permease subunit, partial [Mycoplasmopsis bovis]|uniref:ABC transporter permease subunit n=1 Tax=Mycoplasmopsis bovis TaxID=28903 RepID=UPI003D2A4104
SINDEAPLLIASRGLLLNRASGNTLIPLLVHGIWSGLAFNVLIFTTAMLSVDKNLYKSASIDGIGGIKQFFTITLPSIKSTTTFLITMGIISGNTLIPL